MTAQFEPSAEMIEAGARALCGESFENCTCARGHREVARNVLRAALGLVLSDPCPTCQGTGTIDVWDDDYDLDECSDCYGTGETHRPVWAWLRAAQNSGGMEPVGWRFESSDGPVGCEIHREPQPWGTAVGKWSPLFRVSVPEEGT